MPKQPKSFDNFFASNLQFLMEEFGEKQEILADFLGLSQAAVSNYLKGRVPRPDILVDIGTHFSGISVQDLLFRDLRRGRGLKRMESPQKASAKAAVRLLMQRLERLDDEDAERVARVCLSILETLENPPITRKGTAK